MGIWVRAAFVILILLATSLASAKQFRNAYIAFELPDSWKCVLEATEWVCRSEFDREAREAIIILTAKEVGPTDTFESYEAHLNASKMTTNRAGSPSPSRVVYKSKRVKVNDQPWVDGLHLGSEVPNYFTRYLATVKDRIAILVTFSAHRTHYTKYSKDFFRAVESLRVIATKNLLDRGGGGMAGAGGGAGGADTYGTAVGAGLPIDPSAAQPYPGERKGGGVLKTILFAMALLLALIGGYLFWKSQNR
ncbi:MAG: hypothetical protein AB7O96_11580 [Pseudobdellovibrionaceae bacterium]